MTTIHVHLFTGFVGWALPVLAICGAAYLIEGVFGALGNLAGRIADRLFPPPKRSIGLLQDDQNTLSTRVWAADIPGLEAAALDKARELYGSDAVLKVHRIQDVTTSLPSSTRPPFHANVTVRRLDDGMALSVPAELIEVQR